MRKLVSLKTSIRATLMVSLLGLAACGASPKFEDVSRLERSDLVPSTTEVLRTSTQKSEQRQAKNASFQTMLTAEAATLLDGSGYDIELDVQSFMIPDAVQAKITGARAFVAAKITLKSQRSGDVLVDGTEVTFVAPQADNAATSADALVLAFGAHLQKSLQLR